MDCNRITTYIQLLQYMHVSSYSDTQKLSHKREYLQ